MLTVEINYVAVLISAVTSLVVGSIWYAKGVFGKEWVKLSGHKMASGGKAVMQRMMVGMFVLALVEAYVLAHVLPAFQITDWVGGVQAASWMWVGFIVPTMGANYMFGGKSLKLFAIDAGNHLVTLVLMGIILSVWL